jgi:hypothetical protein
MDPAGEVMHFSTNFCVIWHHIWGKSRSTRDRRHVSGCPAGCDCGCRLFIIKRLNLAEEGSYTCLSSAQRVHLDTTRFRTFESGQRGTSPPETLLRNDRIQKAASGPEPAARMGMTVKPSNRSHRVLYMVVLLVFAVALTTALVLAGERSSEGTKSSTLQSNTFSALRAVCLWGNRDA